MDLGAANRNPNYVKKVGFAAWEALSNPGVLRMPVDTDSLPDKDGRIFLRF
jgi:hypothetical protein